MSIHDPTPPFAKRSLFRNIASAVPTLLVFGCIAAVGVWGHKTGWRAPRFSDLFGSGSEAPKEDWCLKHNVPDSKCIACHPELAGENGADWCKEHGVPESQCTTCHPEILEKGVAGGWCKEHGVPEADCTICHPEIARKGEIPKGDVEVTATGAAAPLKPIRDPKTCQTHAVKIQFASAASVQKAGVHLGKVVERPMAAVVAVNAEVDYDRRHFAKLSSRVPGIAWNIAKQQGDAVRKGDLLALVDSAEVGRAKAEYLQAVTAVDVRTKSLQRVEKSVESGFRNESERLEADASARESTAHLFNARQALVNLGLPLPEGELTPESLTLLGLPDAIVASVPRGSLSANLVSLVAPFDGVVVACDVVAGEQVDTTRTLFEIADTRRMWVAMDAPQSEEQRLALGEDVVFRSDGARDEATTGKVTWISTAVDETTRTIKLRADVDNESGSLRAHSFGRAQIVVRTSEKAVAVPNESVQWEGCCHVVFVRLSDEIFQTRKVRIGAKDAAYTEILVGVLPGEVIATTGSHVLKAELLKSELGAGCCDD